MEFYLVGGFNLSIWKIWVKSQLGWLYYSQLFLESHSKFHGSSHHQPDIGLCPTGQWRLDGDFRFTRDSVALTGTWCLLKRLGHVHIKIRHMGHGYISLHINTHIQILLDRGFTHSFHAESMPQTCKRHAYFMILLPNKPWHVLAPLGIASLLQTSHAKKFAPSHRYWDTIRSQEHCYTGPSCMLLPVAYNAAYS